jgi:myo-inositol-1(or 4)-monophosphatase
MAKAKAKPKTKTRAKTKTKAAAKAKRSKPKAQAQAKAATKARAGIAAKTETRTATKARARTKAKASAKSVTKKKAIDLKKPAQSKKTADAPVPAKTAKAAKPVKTAKGSSTRTKPAVKSRILPKEFMIGLAQAIRKAVEPQIRAVKGREIVGNAPSGDATFMLDKIAEKALLAFLRDAKAPVAYYSEDAGYTTFSAGQPENLLVVDPVDGSRAAKCGFESCVVALASTRVIERPTMADVDNACVLELLGPRVFYAERGKGARSYVDGHLKKPKLSKNADLETMSWAMTVPARPAELIFPTAARLIDISSLKGGFFACNSTSYSLTRLVTDQLDACVDFANRYLRDIPEAVKDHFINSGRGVTLGVAPYDLAAALLIAQEAGCVVTDAYGRSFDDVLLLDGSVSNQRSVIAAANEELHGKLMSFFDKRIKQFELLFKRRAELAAKRKA